MPYSLMIADASGLPVISDADTGYGNPLNVQRTVTAYEKAGVAGILGQIQCAGAGAFLQLGALRL